MHTAEIKVLAGSLEIGTELVMEERLTPSRDVDGLRYRQTLEHVLVPADTVVSFENEGLTQGYVVFGQPGAGKTYFIRQILGQLLRLNEEDEERRYGGLIIDPKGDYPEFVNAAVNGSQYRKNPIIIYPQMQRPINVLHCGLSPENLARILSATCTALAKGADEYFHNNLSVVLSSILVAEDIVARKRHGQAPSVKFLLDVLAGFNGTGGQRKRNLETWLQRLELHLARKPDIQLTAAEKHELQALGRQPPRLPGARQAPTSSCSSSSRPSSRSASCRSSPAPARSPSPTSTTTSSTAAASWRSPFLPARPTREPSSP